MKEKSKTKKRRARLRMGPGGAVYLLASGLILGVAIYTQANLLFWSLGLIVGGLAVSLLLASVALRGVSVQRLLPSHGVAGQPLVLRYQLANRSWLPVLGLIIEESWGRGRRNWQKAGPIAQRPPQLVGRPCGWVLHLGPHQAIQAEATCWPLRRGSLHFDRIVLSSAFPFGVVRKVIEVQQPGAVLVYPNLLRMNRRLLHSLSARGPMGRKHMDRGDGTEEFFGLRSYRAGDSLKLIDWKHSARTGQLVARELTQPSPPRVMVLLDLSPPSGPPTSGDGETTGQGGAHHGHRHAAGDKPPDASEATEAAISLTASLICDAHFHGYQVGLAVAGPRCGVFGVHHSPAHRARMLEALARLDTTEPLRSPPPLIEPPSVLIWPGGAGGPGGGPRPGAAMLAATDINRYVVDPADGDDLPGPRAGPESDRVQRPIRRRP